MCRMKGTTSMAASARRYTSAVCHRRKSTIVDSRIFSDTATAMSRLWLYIATVLGEYRASSRPITTTRSLPGGGRCDCRSIAIWTHPPHTISYAYSAIRKYSSRNVWQFGFFATFAPENQCGRIWTYCNHNKKLLKGIFYTQFPFHTFIT